MIGTCSAATQTVCSNYSCVDLERLDLSERQRGDRIGKSALAPSMSASLAPVPDAEVRSDVRYHSFGATGVDEPQRDWKQRAVPLVAVSIALFGLFAMVHAGTSSPPPPAPMLTNKVARLEIINGCERDPLWIANFAFQTPYFPQDLRLRAGESHGFDIPDEASQQRASGPSGVATRRALTARLARAAGRVKAAQPTAVRRRSTASSRLVLGVYLASNPKDVR